MNARRATLPTALILVVIGLCCFNLRLSTRNGTPIVRGDSFWRLTYTIQFQAKTPNAKLHVAFPTDTVHSRVSRREIRCPDMTMEVRHLAGTDSRQVDLKAHRTGRLTFSAELDLRLSPRAAWRAEDESGRLTAETRARYLRGSKDLPVDDPVVSATLQRLQGEPISKVDLVERLFEYCLAELGTGGTEAPADAVQAMKHGAATTVGRARAMVALCRAAKIPARLVTGFQVKQGADVRPHVWVEVLPNGHWEAYDPDYGFARELPHNYVPVRRDGVSIVHSEGVSGLETTFSIVRLPLPPGSVYSDRRRWIDILDLTRLPLEMHEVLAIILLMPLGALVTSVFRTLIGIRTFGTFTPALIALSFVFADWSTGVLVFVTVMVLGFTARSLLDRLKLLLVPRLSLILTLVSLCLVFSVSLLDYFHWTPSANAVLLPMVILTMSVERFYLTSEEDSMQFAIQLLVGTLFLACCCYLVLRWRTVGQLLLVYPELHLLTAAALILLGRYSGYRLSELWRFRDLAQKSSQRGP